MLSSLEVLQLRKLRPELADVDALPRLLTPQVCSSRAPNCIGRNCFERQYELMSSVAVLPFRPVCDPGRGGNESFLEIGVRCAANEMSDSERLGLVIDQLFASTAVAESL
mmetsp:Transcript_47201/g.125377  ORF Transcript_47201/g.125377 Transcript_47201/m.125377 type:complete len:110 (-) Transcript_47201:1384-1713(-)